MNTKYKYCHFCALLDSFNLVLSNFPFWIYIWASQVALVVKKPTANAGDLRDMCSIPGSGRSPGEGHGNPLQYPWLENPTTEEPGELQFIGSHKVEHDWNDSVHMHSHAHVRVWVCVGVGVCVYSGCIKTHKMSMLYLIQYAHFKNCNLSEQL